VSSIWRNQDRVAGCDLLLSVFISNLPVAFQNVDFMFPVVAVEWGETAGVHCEVTHQKCWCLFLVDEPLYLHTFRTLFSHSGVRRFIQIGFVQLYSLKWELDQ